MPDNKNKVVDGAAAQGDAGYTLVVDERHHPSQIIPEGYVGVHLIQVLIDKCDEMIMTISKYRGMMIGYSPFKEVIEDLTDYSSVQKMWDSVLNQSANAEMACRVLKSVPHLKMYRNTGPNPIDINVAIEDLTKTRRSHGTMDPKTVARLITFSANREQYFILTKDDSATSRYRKAINLINSIKISLTGLHTALATIDKINDAKGGTDFTAADLESAFALFEKDETLVLYDVSNKCFVKYNAWVKKNANKAELINVISRLLPMSIHIANLQLIEQTLKLSNDTDFWFNMVIPRHAEDSAASNEARASGLAILEAYLLSLIPMPFMVAQSAIDYIIDFRNEFWHTTFTIPVDVKVYYEKARAMHDFANFSSTYQTILDNVKLSFGKCKITPYITELVAIKGFDYDKSSDLVKQQEEFMSGVEADINSLKNDSVLRVIMGVPLDTIKVVPKMYEQFFAMTDIISIIKVLTPTYDTMPINRVMEKDKDISLSLYLGNSEHFKKLTFPTYTEDFLHIINTTNSVSDDEYTYDRQAAYFSAAEMHRLSKTVPLTVIQPRTWKHQKSFSPKMLFINKSDEYTKLCTQQFDHSLIDWELSNSEIYSKYADFVTIPPNALHPSEPTEGQMKVFHSMIAQLLNRSKKLINMILTNSLMTAEIQQLLSTFAVIVRGDFKDKKVEIHPSKYTIYGMNYKTFYQWHEAQLTKAKAPKLLYKIYSEDETELEGVYFELLQYIPIPTNDLEYELVLVENRFYDNIIKNNGGEAQKIDFSSGRLVTCNTFINIQVMKPLCRLAVVDQDLMATRDLVYSLDTIGYFPKVEARMYNLGTPHTKRLNLKFNEAKWSGYADDVRIKLMLPYTAKVLMTAPEQYNSRQSEELMTLKVQNEEMQARFEKLQSEYVELQQIKGKEITTKIDVGTESAGTSKSVKQKSTGEHKIEEKKEVKDAPENVELGENDQV